MILWDLEVVIWVHHGSSLLVVDKCLIILRQWVFGPKANTLIFFFPLYIHGTIPEPFYFVLFKWVAD